MRKLMLVAILFAITFLTRCGYTQAQDLPKINNLRSQQLMAKFGSSIVLNDLELVLSQRTRINEVFDELKEELLAIRKSKSGSRIKAIEACNAISFKKVFDEVLLPHQRVRFIQLVHQGEVRRLGGGLSKYIVQPGIRSQIGITNEQVNAIDAVQSKHVQEMEAAADEFRKRIAAILAEEEKEAMLLLGEEKAKKVADLIGERNVMVKSGSEAVFYLDQVFREK